MMKQDVIELVEKHGIEAADEFWSSAECEGLVYYITNFGNPYKSDEIYKKYMNKPFFEALEFIETLNSECQNYLYNNA